MRSWPHRAKGVAVQLWLPLTLLGAWYFASRHSQNVYFPPLEAIWKAFVVELESGRFLANLRVSMSNLALGLAAGVLAGVVFGLLIGQSRRAREVLNPYLQFARAVPQVALLPVIIGALGIASGPKIWAIAFATIWPVLLNTIDGVRAIDPAVRDMVRAYRIPHRLNLSKVVLPASMPQIAAGIRVSLSIAVVLVVVSEIYGSAEGLGYFINQSGSTFNVPATWAGTLSIGVLGYVLNGVFVVIEKSTLKWYFESAA